MRICGVSLWLRRRWLVLLNTIRAGRQHVSFGRGAALHLIHSRVLGNRISVHLLCRLLLHVRLLLRHIVPSVGRIALLLLWRRRTIGGRCLGYLHPRLDGGPETIELAGGDGGEEDEDDKEEDDIEDNGDGGVNLWGDLAAAVSENRGGKGDEVPEGARERLEDGGDEV